MLASLSAARQSDSDNATRVERKRLVVIENPAVGQCLEGLWDTDRAGLLRMVQSFAPVPATGGFADALRGLGHSLETDERLNGEVNGYARRAVVGAIQAYGGTEVPLVSDTIASWDASHITARHGAAGGR